jgi:hypothetical protein
MAHGLERARKPTHLLSLAVWMVREVDITARGCAEVLVRLLDDFDTRTLMSASSVPQSRPALPVVGDVSAICCKCYIGVQV